MEIRLVGLGLTNMIKRLKLLVLSGIFAAIFSATPVICLAQMIPATEQDQQIRTPPAQTTIPGISSTTAQAQPPVAAILPPTSESSESLRLREDIKKLEDHVNGLQTFIQTVFVIFVAVPIIFAIIGSFSVERRAQQIHDVAIAGARNTESRTQEIHEKFLNSSKFTLDLVNSTLQHAQNAIEQTARLHAQKTEEQIRLLNTQAQKLLDDVRYENERVLVSQSGYRPAVEKIGGDVQFFQSTIQYSTGEYRNQISGACKFLLGLHFHLKGLYDQALTSWRDAAAEKGEDEATKYLRSLAWYWIGYEQNNLANFSDAVVSFRHSEELASPDRKWELQRIRIESGFFAAPGQAAAFAVEMEKLLKLIDQVEQTDGIKKRRARIANNLGNIFYEAGREADNESTISDEARRYYIAAEKLFRDAKDIDMWARFGLAQTLMCLEKNQNEAIDLFRKTREDVIQEDVDRIEKRTKILARTSEWICCAYVPEYSEDFATVRKAIADPLGDIIPELTIYSQFQKRNVKRPVFIRELNYFYSRKNLRPASKV